MSCVAEIVRMQRILHDCGIEAEAVTLGVDAYRMLMRDLHETQMFLRDDLAVTKCRALNGMAVFVSEEAPPGAVYVGASPLCP